jgi:hypothetical protein
LARFSQPTLDLKAAQLVKPVMPLAKTLFDVVKSSSGSSKVLAAVRAVGKVLHRSSNDLSDPGKDAE